VAVNLCIKNTSSFSVPALRLSSASLSLSITEQVCFFLSLRVQSFFTTNFIQFSLLRFSISLHFALLLSSSKMQLRHKFEDRGEKTWIAKKETSLNWEDVLRQQRDRRTNSFLIHRTRFSLALQSCFIENTRKHLDRPLYSSFDPSLYIYLLFTVAFVSFSFVILDLFSLHSLLIQRSEVPLFSWFFCFQNKISSLLFFSKLILFDSFSLELLQ
jgi:hypothetical protein